MTTRWGDWRNYADFARLSRPHQVQRLFVTRAKRNFRFWYLDPRPVDHTTGVYSDQITPLYGFCSKQS